MEKHAYSQFMQEFILREPAYNIVVGMQNEYTTYYNQTKINVFHNLHRAARPFSALSNQLFHHGRTSGDDVI